MSQILTAGAGAGVQILGTSAYLPSDNPASLVAWFRMGVGVTVTGAGVSQWDDQSGNANHLLQATDTNRPTYDGSAIITFDGVDNFLNASFTLAQPTQVSLLMSQVTWTSNDYFFDGFTAATGNCRQRNASPQIEIQAGGALVATNSNLAVGVFSAVTVLFSGASSSLVVDATAETTGNPGTGTMGGFTLGSRGGGLLNFGNISVKEVILRNVDDATIRANDHAYLQTL